MTWSTVWSPPVVVKGLPPVGEVETRCAGCRRRLVAGEEVVSRVVGPIGPVVSFVYAHPACALSVDGAL